METRVFTMKSFILRSTTDFSSLVSNHNNLFYIAFLSVPYYTDYPGNPRSQQSTWKRKLILKAPTQT